MAVLGALALVVAVVAVGRAAVVWARALGAAGALETAVAAAPLGAAAVAVETLLLGRLELGGSAVALLLAAVATWALTAALARRRAAAAEPGRAERRPPLARPPWVAGALDGAALAWLAWLVKHPWLGVDPLSYHLPESVLWTQSGRSGAVELLQYDFPLGDYPVTNELLVSWTTGLTHGFGAALLWTPAVAALAVAAGWLGLRRAGADRLVGAFALAAVLLTPVAVTQVIGPHTDLPALAWLWTTGALLLAARRSPALWCPALAAAGLALGSKTTPAPLLVLLLGWALWTQRGALRAGAWRPAALGAALAVGAGGVWYLRNLLVHGSPLYPFKAAPWGDPMPAFLARLDVSFLQRPGETLARNGAAWVDGVAGGLLVLVLGLLAVAGARRSRAAAWTAGVTAVALLTWAAAPFTGAAQDRAIDVSLSTIRYLLPAIGVAGLAVALAARGAPSRLRLALAALLALAVAWSLVAAQGLSVIAIPSFPVLAAGALAGLVLAAAARRVALTARPAAAGALAALLLLVLVAGHGFARRQGSAPWLPSSGVVSWAAAQPGWQDEDFPVAFAPQLLAPLAGERLQHRIALVGAREPCARVRARARAGWVVVGTFPFADRREPFTAAACFDGVRPRYADGTFAVYGPPTG